MPFAFARHSCILLAASCLSAAPESVCAIGSRLEPLVDRYLIDRLDGTELRLIIRSTPDSHQVRFALGRKVLDLRHGHQGWADLPDVLCRQTLLPAVRCR